MSALALTFRIFRGDQLVREETLRQSVIKIGKVPSAHLRVDDESVSRMHAILEVDTRGAVHAIDLGSTRGTFINGHKIHKAKLESGDALQVGDLRIEVAFARTDAVIAPPVMAAVPPPVPGSALPPPLPHPVAVVAAPPVLPVAPPALPFIASPQEDDLSGAKAIEIAAMLGDSVVGVKHCIDPKSGKVSSRTWGLFAAGAACLVASAIAFGVSVHTAAFNKGGLDYTTHVLRKPAYAFRPEVLNPAFDWIAFGGLAVGLAALIAGLARMRGERRTPYYRIGTAPGVELALDSAPAASFPLVAPSADGEDFVFNYTPAIEGEVVVDGRSSSLADLAASGRARASLTTAGAVELPIPSRAKIRARSGQTTFVVSAVPQPRRQPVSLIGAMESRTVRYFIGSLGVHLALLALVAQMPADDSAAAIEVDTLETASINVSGTEKELTPDKVDPTEGSESGDPGNATQKMALEAGAAGNPASEATNRRLAVKDNHLDHQQLSREEAIEMARQEGIMGMVSASPDNFQALAAAANISNGMDGVNAYGAMFGAEAGEAHGSFGGSLSGFGRGGGCSQEPCGTIGRGGRYDTISNGTHSGSGWGPGGGIGGAMRRHDAGVPRPVLGQATGVGDIDQATIRRYIKRNIEKIGYCYEHELLAHPEMEGTVTVQFFISPTGAVTGSKGSGFDGTVAHCVADVVGNIEFPRPNGGGVQVNYPFTFHAAGH